MTAGSEDTFPPEEPDFLPLKALSKNLIDYFQGDTSEAGNKIKLFCENIVDSLEVLSHSLPSISYLVHEYDFDADTPANGHRSFLFITQCLLKRTERTFMEINSSKASYFFRKEHYARELEANSQALESICVLISYLKVLMSWCDEGSLFPREHHKPEELFESHTGFINQYCFYGRCLGFQFCKSMAVILKALCILMASFSEVYYSRGRVIDSLWKGSKYLIDPEIRAKRIVQISQYASADFCKNFWFLGEMELMHRLPSIVNPTLAVSRVIHLPPAPIQIFDRDGNLIDIPVPSSYKGLCPLPVRLISSVARIGMPGVTRGRPAAQGLVFHCHGGGFVAQSSRSHETYLRQWAMQLDCPILSVDYSLAPESPYPRALEEAFYAYCWALQNAEQLGTTAERIVLAGDSAGANINMGVTLKTIEYNIRKPDGLFLAYAPVILAFVPSPSRLLCLMDPLLPFGFLLGCTKAYVCSAEVYAQSNIHERKLRWSKKVSPKNSSTNLPSTAVEDAMPEVATPEDYSASLIDGEDAAAAPVIMELPEPKNGGGIFSRIMTALSNKWISLAKPPPSSLPYEDLEEEIAGEMYLPCPLDMLDFEVPHDPFISPYYASPEVLKQFPPVSVLSLDLDPFLDDCIEFSKRLRDLGNPVKLDVLSGLSHGFLNFSMLSKEAFEGSKLCICRINELLSLEENGN